MQKSTAILSTLAVVFSANTAVAAIVPFGDVEAFREAAANVREIDFEALPDGSPLTGSVEITPTFNFTDQGVTFSSSLPLMQQMGGSGGELVLVSQLFGEGAERIISNFVTPVMAVGIMVPSAVTLSVYDIEDQLLGRVRSAGGEGAFIGIVSSVPIATATGSRGRSFSFLTYESFLFTPVPEPATLALLAFGAAALLYRRR